MKLSQKAGTALAATAAVMLLSGTVTVPTSSAVAEDAKVQCYGVNECKGQASCKTANNACKGQNSCKGKGFLELTKEECDAKGGEVKS